jgi:hypothetical protein
MKLTALMLCLIGLVGQSSSAASFFRTKCPPVPPEPDGAVLCAALPELGRWVQGWTDDRPVVFLDDPAHPEFPWSKAQAAQVAAADPAFDPSEQAAPDRDLDIDNGPTVSAGLIASAILRSESLALISQPECGNVIMVDGKKLNRLYRTDIPAGWRRFWRLFPESSGVVSCSAPGYDTTGNEAIVFCSHTMGAAHGVGVFMMLEKRADTWRISWARSVWVS